MKVKFAKLAVAAVTATAFAIPLLSAADLPDQTLDDYKIGKTLVGEVDDDNLEGKVVVIEYWGTR